MPIYLMIPCWPPSPCSPGIVPVYGFEANMVFNSVLPFLGLFTFLPCLFPCSSTVAASRSDRTVLEVASFQEAA